MPVIALRFANHHILQYCLKFNFRNYEIISRKSRPVDQATVFSFGRYVTCSLEYRKREVFTLRRQRHRVLGL
jgi:hypothetical protein